MTAAVTEAIRERLARIRAERGDADLDIERLLALAREIGERMPPGYLDVEHGDRLYDEMGLPK